jgi:hypothetical protein
MITDAEAERLAVNKITAARTLEEDRRIAFHDPRRFVTAEGNLQPITNWTQEMAAAVASIEVVRRNVAGGDGHSDTVVKICFWNRIQALELLCKHLGLLGQPDADDDRPTVPVFLLPPGSRVETK